MPTLPHPDDAKPPMATRWLRTCKLGASGIEYGILLGLMAIVTLVAVGSTGGIVYNTFCDVAASVGSAAADPSMTCPGSAAPVWSANPYFTGNYTTAGSSYSTTLAAATTSDNATITYSFVSSSQPGGTLDPKTLRFTLPAPQAGIEQVVVNATTKGAPYKIHFMAGLGRSEILGHMAPFAA